jgi:hypothetical protein
VSAHATPAPLHADAEPDGNGGWTVRVAVPAETDAVPDAGTLRVEPLDSSPPLRVDAVQRVGGQLGVRVSLAYPLAAGDPERGAYLLRLAGGGGEWAPFALELAPAPAPPAPGAPTLPAGASIDYTARDYDGFRTLMLGYLSAVEPRWQERSPADLGVALVEVLAYAADNLSYMQDSAATETYLRTSRLRTSLRRHARLLDYVPSDGCSALAWVQVSVTAPTELPAGTQLSAPVPGAPPVLLNGGDAHRAALAGARVFETRAALRALPGLNAASLYAWGAADFTLPAGATGATLRDRALPGGGRALDALSPGDVLVLEEARSPATGRTEDADPVMRQAVLLRTVTRTTDPRAAGGEVPVVDVAWAGEDALRFVLRVAGTVGTTAYADGARARGNVVLADHGASSPWTELWPGADGAWRLPGDAVAASRVLPHGWVPAYAVLGTAPDPAATHPAVQVRDAAGRSWLPRLDLLQAGPFSRAFVAEAEGNAPATLRFGDGRLGMRPPAGAPLYVRWRTGFGPEGNVGPDTLVHLVAPDAARWDRWTADVLSVGNPVPAGGGAAAETAASIRARAPWAFHAQARCVTDDDWAAAAAALPGVASARAESRWTGSWTTVVVSVQPAGGGQAGAELLDRVRASLEPLRPAGHDVAVRGPRWAALRIVLEVTVQPERTARAVQAALAAALGDGVAADGTPAFFHPDRLGFGDPVYLSPLLAAAMAVPGVLDVRALWFCRAGVDDGGTLASICREAVPGCVRDPIHVGPGEIARAAVGAGAAWRGSLSFCMVGGR